MHIYLAASQGLIIWRINHAFPRLENEKLNINFYPKKLFTPPNKRRKKFIKKTIYEKGW